MLNRSSLTQYIQPLVPVPTSLKPSGKLVQQIRCVLFDIYGTLFISGSGDIGIARKELRQAEKLEKLLRKFGISKSPQSVLDELFTGIEETHELLEERG